MPDVPVWRVLAWLAALSLRSPLHVFAASFPRLGPARWHTACQECCGAPWGRKGGFTVSRIVLIVTALVVGAVLAVGAAFTTTALVGNSSGVPANQAAYNYGS